MYEVAISPYGKGWYTEPGTGSSFATVTRLKAAAVASAFLIGTGGTMNAEYLSSRNNMGYRFCQVVSSTVPQAVSYRTPAEHVINIRRVFKPTVSEIASLFQVSRQTIYDWQNGTRPAPEYEKKLEDLSKAADIFLFEGVPITPYLLKRRVAGGKTIFDIAREGGSVVEAARQLAEIVLRESRQRKALDARLESRKLPPVDYAEAGVPAFKERF